jgi:hypothetical protein
MGTTATPNIMAGVKFTLLGTELTAGYSKSDDGQRIFVHQDVSATNDGVTIQQMIGDVRRLLGVGEAEAVPELTEEKVKDKLAPLTQGAFDINAIRVILSTVYLKVFIPTTGARTVEYALKVDVKMEGLISTDIKLINIKALTLAVWNTTDESVKKQMALLANS